MRMMLRVTVPVEKGNETLKNGTLPQIVGGAIERLRPEAAYFYTDNGVRTGMMIIDLKDTSDIPPIAEQFYMGLDAKVEFIPVMNAEELKAGISRIGK